MINHLDLCSGIGGFALGFEWAKLSKPIAFCDTDEYCRKVLRKNYQSVPIFNDVKELANDTTRFISQKVDILTSGYPCQPFSVSGKRKGEKDERHIFPYIQRIVEQTRPTYCVFENVYGHLSLGLDEVLFAMESIDYHTRTFIFPSSSIGAWHKRDRLWIVCKDITVCNSQHDGSSSSKKRQSNEEITERTQKGTKTPKQLEGTVRSTNDEPLPNTNDQGVRSCLRGSDNDLQKEGGEWGNDRRESTSNDEWSNIAAPKNEDLELSNTKIERLQGCIVQSKLEDQEYRQDVAKRSLEEQRTWWEVEHELRGVPNGVSTELDKDRSNRLKALGNAICPQNAMYIGLAIKEDMKNY